MQVILAIKVEFRKEFHSFVHLLILIFIVFLFRQMSLKLIKIKEIIKIVSFVHYRFFRTDDNLIKHRRAS